VVFMNRILAFSGSVEAFVGKRLNRRIEERRLSFAGENRYSSIRAVPRAADKPPALLGSSLFRLPSSPDRSVPSNQISTQTVLECFYTVRPFWTTILLKSLSPTILMR
jgi:hypothetical protein